MTADTLLQQINDYINNQIKPVAGEYDRQQNLPRDVIDQLAALGCLGLNVPAELGGTGVPPILLGQIIKSIATVSGSLASLLIVHLMVCESLVRWGSQEQQQLWLPKLASGECYAAFALSEPEHGSDIASISTQLQKTTDCYELTGVKKWISGAQHADLFLLFAYQNDQPVACLVEAKQAGVTIEPLPGMVGFRGAMLGLINCDAYRLTINAIVGKAGTGISHVATTALDLGRYCMGWLSLGLAKACIASTQIYINQRHQFKQALKEHQLIKRRLTQMISQYKAAQHLCLHAGKLRGEQDPALIIETSIAKYFAAEMVQQVASHAMHIHGANGLHESSELYRYLNDAKVLAIIEGSTEIQEILIADYAAQAPIQ